jgi:anti-sigma factor RsiW
MISGHLEEETLQRYFDGELTDGSGAEVEQHLESCEQCRARRQSLERLHELINVAAEDLAAEVDFDAVYERVTRGVAEPQPAAEVVSLGSWRDRLRASRPQVWVPLAAAAAVAFAVIGNFAAPHEREVARPRPAPKPRVMVAEANVAGQASSEVVQVDFGQNTGTVFEVPVSDDVSTPVVWINDEIEDEPVAP